MPIEGRGRESADARIRLGMVGGGEGAFIGAVHRLAARMDDHYVLVAGALSSTPEKAQRSGKALGLAPDRIYDDFETMAKEEAKRPDGIEAVAIVTPNDTHAPASKAFLKAGIHVICDKPLTLNLKEALSLEKAVKQSGKHLRPHPQLHRLSDGAARPRDGEGGRPRRDPRGAGGVSAGLADREDRGYRPEAGSLAQRSQARRRRRLPRRHRHACPQHRRVRDRAGAGRRSAPTSPAS